ncbi:MAG: hypothetical protein JWP58_669 [Hymenobacter sp.]|nr:hypothetical protein [Hymenobacter sp.]
MSSGAEGMAAQPRRKAQSLYIFCALVRMRDFNRLRGRFSSELARSFVALTILPVCCSLASPA